MNPKRKRLHLPSSHGSNHSNGRKLEIAKDQSSCDVTRNKSSKDERLCAQYHGLMHPDFYQLSNEYPEFKTALRNLRESQKKATARMIDPPDIHRWEDVEEQNSTDTNPADINASFSYHIDHSFNVALTRALLHKYFRLSIPFLPKGYLCPPVPNRFNYVLWIQSLLSEMYDSDDTYFVQDTKTKHGNPAKETCMNQRAYRGLDLGTGASAIYPLLLSTKDFTGSEYSMSIGQKRGEDQAEVPPRPRNLVQYHPWKFLGTDIDPYSVQCAKDNVAANGLQHVISIALVPPTTNNKEAISDTSCFAKNESTSCEKYLTETPDVMKPSSTVSTHDMGPIYNAMCAAKDIYCEEIPSGPSEDNRHINVNFDFCMTNPPFYSTTEDATLPRRGDSRDRTSMTLLEGVYNDGEVGFVFDMIKDSLKFKQDITWYTSMLGKKTSVLLVEKKLKELGFDRGSLRRTEFVQGRNVRWGIAWTFRTAALRSPVTLLDWPLCEFDVLVPCDCDGKTEIFDRIQNFFEKQKELKYTTERGDKQLSFLSTPFEGVPEWLIDFQVHQSKKNTPVTSNSTFSGFVVHLSCYSNTFCGDTKIKNITCKIKGEVGQSNRRWRRKQGRTQLESEMGCSG